MQLITIICLGVRTSNRIEADKRISKYNCGSRKVYSIDTTLLEKGLIFDHAIKTEEVNVCTVSDLKDYYVQQIPELCGSV